MKKKKENSNASGLKIIPLGGLEQIGMNITAFQYEDSIIVVDCGLSFPADDMLGIDLVIPDVTYLKDNIDKVKGFVITHGHEDHIGALPYVLRDINVPIYATRLTMGIIENKLTEHNLMKKTKRKVVKFGQSINLGDFRVEFIKTNHSIVDAAALAIYSPAGIVVHTGDFKVDYTPVYGDAIDLQRFAEIGKKGVLALMCDSTNAERPGFTPSEKTVGKTFDTLFEEHKNKSLPEFPDYPLTFQKDGHFFEIFRGYTDCLYSSYGTKWNGNAAANNGSLFVVQDDRLRRLSPLECERLMGFPDNYTQITGARRTNRYQATGNSWAVPVIKWLGKRLMNPACILSQNPIPMKSDNDMEYHDFSKGIIQLNSTEWLNCSSKPEKCIFGDMSEIVSADAPKEIYISPVGCYGILRRSRERNLAVNERLEIILDRIAREMSVDDIEKYSLRQQRGKYSLGGKKSEL